MTGEGSSYNIVTQRFLGVPKEQGVSIAKNREMFTNCSHFTWAEKFFPYFWEIHACIEWNMIVYTFIFLL